MSIKIITSFVTLMRYARELGQAKLNGDKKLIEKVQRKHDEYRDICLKSDKMML